mgnify:CR=1 FL=1|jgi:heme exporter protein A
MTENTMAKPQKNFLPNAYPDPAHLRLEGLACSRGARQLFEGISQTLAPGEALALYGANGSGKTSLLRQIAGFLPVEVGTISFGDTRPPRVHFIGHADGLKNPLRVGETLAFDAALWGAPKNAIDLLPLLGLDNRGWQTVGDLSAGQRRRLALAKLCLAPRPVWLLDEPMTALDAAGQHLIDTLAGAHLAAGGILVASSHVPLGFATQTLTLGAAS